MTPILYSIDCPKCKVLQKKLNDANIQYVYCTDKAKMAALGFTSLPMLYADNKYMDFSEAINWIGKRNGGAE